MKLGGYTMLNNIIGKQFKEFYETYERHRMNISTTNVYFQNIRLLNTYKTEIVSRDDYKEYYESILKDIENKSSPIECLVPNEQKLINEDSDDPNTEIKVPEGYKLFLVNQLTPEYVEISKRIKADNMDETFPASHPIRMTIKENPEKFEQLTDEIFIHWLTFRYLENIEKLHIQSFSNYTPIIEWVVENIDEKQLKSFLTSKNINQNKVRSKTHEFIFKPDLSRMKKFYDEDHEGIDHIDVVDLLSRLTSNICVKSDIHIVAAIYLTLSFAMSDIYNKKIDDSPCAKYVRDVLSKI